MPWVTNPNRSFLFINNIRMYKHTLQPFSSAEQSALQQLFRKYAKAADGHLDEEGFKNLVKEFETRPEPYQITTVRFPIIQLFAHDALQGRLNEDQFRIWYWAFSVGFLELAYFRFDLWRVEREMRSAAPPFAGPT